MSGGSYNYLCHAWGLEDLLKRKEDLERMWERLAGLGYAKDAASETYDLLLRLRQWETAFDTISTRLNGVWHAIEWWDSCDSGEDDVKEALEKYRSIKP